VCTSRGCGRQREREKQTPRGAGSPLWDLIPGPRDHYLSQRQTLNRLSHPGIPQHFLKEHLACRKGRWDESRFLKNMSQSGLGKSGECICGSKRIFQSYCYFNYYNKRIEKV